MKLLKYFLLFCPTLVFAQETLILKTGESMRVKLLRTKQRHIVKVVSGADTLTFRSGEVEKIVGDNGRLITFDPYAGRPNFEWYEEHRNQIHSNKSAWLVQYTAVVPATRYGFQVGFISKSRLGLKAGYSSGKRLDRGHDFYADISYNAALNDCRGRFLETKKQTSVLNFGVLFQVRPEAWLSASVNLAHTEMFAAFFDPRKIFGGKGAYFVRSPKPDKDAIGFTIGGMRFINQHSFYGVGFSSRPLGVSLSFGVVVIPFFTVP